MSALDLNADVGELDPELDARIIEAVTSVSIACGGHAGDDATMSAVTAMAAARDVRVGAHPSFVDRDNFGRIRHDIAPETLMAQVRDQIQRLIANSPVPVRYVKPHGALYHAAAVDPAVARAVVEASDGIPLMGQHGSVYLTLAEAEGIPVIHEGFADRAYTDAGTLVPRSEPSAVLHDAQAVLEQVKGLAQGRVRSAAGTLIDVRADSVCLHSDTPGAADLAVLVAAHLKANGVEVRAHP